MNEDHEKSPHVITEADIDTARASKAKQAECPHHRHRMRCDGCNASLPRPEPGAGARGRTVDIVFDGPPSHESGRFVEVEVDGRSINLGEWVERPDGMWVLRIQNVG